MRIKKIIIIFICVFSIFSMKAQNFTIGTLPDIQNLSTDSIVGAMLNQEFQYFADNKNALNLKFVASLGDNTTYGYDKYQSPIADWQRVKGAFNILKKAGIPYSICIGNHDMDYVPCMDKQELALTRFDSFFPVSEFSGTSTFGGYFRNMSNNYHLFSASGMDFIVVTIQTHDPHSFYDLTSIAWANKILDEYPNRRAIFCTHDFFDVKGLINDVIKKHDNLFMAICGHTCAREVYTQELSPSGNKVNVIVTDYQCDADHGATMRYYTFKPAENKIYAYTYNVTKKTFESDANSEFTIDYKMTKP